METGSCTITIHMVSSLDGFIASKDNSIGWFDTPDFYEKGIVPQNAEEFLATIDCYVMGARTYELALELSKNYGWAYGDKPTIVLTHRHLPIERQSVSTYAGDLHAFVKERLQPNYKNVWVVGGSVVANEFIRLQLANEIRLTVIPILLGDGTAFFHPGNNETLLHLKDVTAYKNGMVELWYQIKQQPPGQ